jgi:opacity protein-like surface antigen
MQQFMVGLILFFIPLFAMATTSYLSFGGGRSFTTEVATDQSFQDVAESSPFYRYKVTNTSESTSYFRLSLGREWQLPANLSLDTGLAYGLPTQWRVKGTITQGVEDASADQFNYQYKIKSKEFLVETKLSYEYLKIHPYFLLGLGAAFNRDFNYEVFMPSFLTFTPEYSDHTEVAFTYEIGLGANYALATNLQIGCGIVVMDLGKNSLGEGQIDGDPFSETLQTKHFYVYSLLMQLTFLL